MRNLLEKLLNSTITEYSEKYPEFKETYSSYVNEYASGALNLKELVDLKGTLEPVLIIIGENVLLNYRDSDGSLEGNVGRINIEPGQVYIIGRRHMGDHLPDGLLRVWSGRGETILAKHSKSFTDPSRIHAAIFALSGVPDQILFADLGSSAGSVVIGAYMNISNGKYLIRQFYEGRVKYGPEAVSGRRIGSPAARTR